MILLLHAHIYINTCVCVKTYTHIYQYMCVLATQSCLTFRDPMNFPGSTVHGILQVRILEWVAIPFSRGSDSRIEPESPMLQADSLPSEPPWKPYQYTHMHKCRKRKNT